LVKGQRPFLDVLSNLLSDQLSDGRPG
jgi:hypothetical protein